MVKKFEIQLKYPFLYKWNPEGNISLITNSMSSGLFRHFASISNETDAVNLLENTDGNFAIVINEDKFFLAAVDRVRSFPLLYKIESDTLFLTDNILEVENEFVFDEKAVQSFQENYCTEGSETLLQNWKQLAGGQYLFVNKDNSEISIQNYFRFTMRAPQHSINNNILRKIFLDVFQSILSEIGDRPIIVPLSAGYDSRCIVAILKELNAKNIFCYTYGRADSFEKVVAKKVAASLQLNWVFIEYTAELLDLFFNDEWNDFSSKGHFFTSLPNEQDFFALSLLQKNNLLPKDGVVLSGYLGGALAGNRNSFKGVPDNDADQEEYNFSNRGSKYIVNSIHLYEYFGLQWYMPFVAKPLIEYSLYVPVDERFFKNGYHNFLSEAFFKPLNIDFRKSNHDYRKHTIKNFFKAFLPQNLVNFIRSKNAKSPFNDPNNTAYLQKKMIATSIDKKQKYVGADFNALHAEQFIMKLRKMISFRGHI
ncbi:MAG: asparagine synthase C-terminal domain-containing protein [Ginsengibacter sp.]